MKLVFAFRDLFDEMQFVGMLSKMRLTLEGSEVFDLGFFQNHLDMRREGMS